VKVDLSSQVRVQVQVQVQQKWI